MQERAFAAEGVTLSGTVLVGLYADSTPEKSTQMGTEGESTQVRISQVKGRRSFKRRKAGFFGAFICFPGVKRSFGSFLFFKKI